MPAADVALLIGAIAGLIVAVGGVVVPVVLASRKDRAAKPAVVQGQTVGPRELTPLERAEDELAAYRRALQQANDQAAHHGLPLHHPDI